jgi:hypothetical protein
VSSGWYAPPPPPRRTLSTGAIVGIVLGGVAALVVVLLVVVLAAVSIAHSTSRLAASQSGSSVIPFDPPTDPPSADASGAPEIEDYDVDGVHIHYVDGWTFELTSGETCAGATVTAGFAETPDGDTLDEWTGTVDLEAGVPYTLTIPDEASVYDFAGIDAVDCTQA